MKTPKTKSRRPQQRRVSRRPTFAIEVTRAEFLKLPMALRRKALSKQTDTFMALEKKQQRIEHLLDVLRDRHALIDKMSKRREDQALDCLVALALRIDMSEVTQAEIAEYMHKPVNLSDEDRAALKRAHPKLLEALREELRPDAKRITACGKPANAELSEQPPKNL